MVLQTNHPNDFTQTSMFYPDNLDTSFGQLHNTII